MKVTEIEAKGIVTRSRLPDADYVINPYIGCQLACGYCYADFMSRFTGHSGEVWGDFVDVKTNAPDLIPKRNFEGKTILIGSVTDPYQQAEGKYGITRGVLEKLLPSQPYVEILTKSGLVGRDIDLLQQFEHLQVGVSLNTLDKCVARELEPFASSPQARLRTLRKLSESGISTYLFVSPIFPGFTDSRELVEASTDFVDRYAFENLNIRSNNRASVLKFVKKNKPELGELYKGLPQNSEFWANLKSEIEAFCEEMGIKAKFYFSHKEERK